MIFLVFKFKSWHFSKPEISETKKTTTEILNIKNESTEIKSNKKYIKFQCVTTLCGGYADRLDGILSAYAWSLITNRNFLIEWTQPCDLNNLFDANKIEWNKNIGNNLNEKIISTIDDFKFIEQLLTLDITKYMEEIDIISFRNNQDWLESISKNLILANRIKELGYEPTKFKHHFLFNEWYNALFKLKPHLEERYQKFLQLAKANDSSELICAQIRMGGGIYNDFVFNEMNDSNIIFSFIKQNFSKKLENKNFKIFITTDTKLVETKAIEEFGSEKIVLNDGAIIHIDKDEMNLKECSKVERTLLDFHSLQNCDFAIVSNSGYGMFGVLNQKTFPKELYIYQRPNFIRIENLEYFNSLRFR